MSSLDKWKEEFDDVWRKGVKNDVRDFAEASVVKETLRCHAILHEHFMGSSDPNVLYALEAVQHEILGGYEPKVIPNAPENK